MLLLKQMHENYGKSKVKLIRAKPEYFSFFSYLIIWCFQHCCLFTEVVLVREKASHMLEEMIFCLSKK